MMYKIKINVQIDINGIKKKHSLFKRQVKEHLSQQKVKAQTYSHGLGT